ncbi:MAG: hypothetical protein MJZ60_07500 [Bacteroidaceae bacterium]|nr:hypothetical protein [Bacteroidaceae bacterium]
MGKVKTNWLMPGHSGRACNHEDIYTKQNRKTGKVYSVKVCNPSTSTSAKQLAQRSKFGAVNSAISAWIKENRDNATEEYRKVKVIFDRQNTYSTLRGMMVAKGYATIDAQGKVTITVGGKTTTTSSSGTGGSVGTGDTGDHD